MIELRYNGRLDDRPINLTGQRLTIRAGDGYTPTVNFKLRESDLVQSHSMIALGGGQSTWIGVQLELDVPREVVAENLTLAEIRPGESIRLDGCTLTIRNAADGGASYHPDVAFFDIRAVPGPGVMASKDSPMMRPAASLQLKNCIVRGEAMFLRAERIAARSDHLGKRLARHLGAVARGDGRPERSQAAGSNPDRTAACHGPGERRLGFSRGHARCPAAIAARDRRQRLHPDRQRGRAPDRPNGRR